MMNPPIEEPARPCRFQVQPGHAGRPPGPQHQLVLQPARRRPRPHGPAAGVARSARKPLSIGFEEIAADKIVWTDAPRRARGRRRSSCRRSTPTSPTTTTPSPDPASAMLAGKRIVLGVTGGIAAYKAVEVCRRLVDAGAHVVPVMTKGAEHFIGRTTLQRAGQRAGADRAVGRADADPAHPARPEADLVLVAPATARHHRRLRRRAVDRPAHQHAARHPGAGA